jgi:regulator of sirC expression with transglutaminase-like and TPR domain
MKNIESKENKVERVKKLLSKVRKCEWLFEGQVKYIDNPANLFYNSILARRIQEVENPIKIDINEILEK